MSASETRRGSSTQVCSGLGAGSARRSGHRPTHSSQSGHQARYRVARKGAQLLEPLTPVRMVRPNHSGISRKMAMLPASHCERHYSCAITIRMAASVRNSLVRARRSRSAPETPTPSLFGASSSMTADKPASTAPSSGTKVSTVHRSLSDRLTQSLITAGLVKGITHTSIRKVSGAPIRASALWPLDGDAADAPEAASSSSNDDEPLNPGEDEFYPLQSNP